MAPGLFLESGVRGRWTYLIGSRWVLRVVLGYRRYRCIFYRHRRWVELGYRRYRYGFYRHRRWYMRGIGGCEMVRIGNDIFDRESQDSTYYHVSGLLYLGMYVNGST